MKQDHRAAALRALIAAPGPLIVPGIHDGFSARLVQASAFQAGFVSGAGVSMSRLGQADLAFLSVSDMADTLRALSLACSIPLIVDIDTGYGSAHNAAACVRQLERAGAAALQMEDQTFPKRCGHLAGKSLIPALEMASKVRAACGARANPATMIIARTDALAVTGLQDALTRCDLYLEAGADALFVEAPRSIEEMKAIAAYIGGRSVLVHNFVEGGKSPIASAHELEPLGYKVGLFPLANLHAAIPSQQALLGHLKASGQTRDWSGAMADLHELNDLLGLASLLESAKSYADDEA
jgi:2-methylisocitrate lyase-like PEP mutase family enzyme